MKFSATQRIEHCVSLSIVTQSIYDNLKQNNILVTVTSDVCEAFRSKIGGGGTETGASTFIDFIVYLVLVYCVLLE